MEPEPQVQVPATLFISLAVAILLLVLFAWMAREVLRGDAENFDRSVRMWVHQHASSTMTRLMTAISMLGGQVLALEFVVALAAFLALRWRRAAAWLAIAVAGAILLEYSLKLVFQRPRPTGFFAVSPHDYSFPSGHALVSFCFYGVVAGLLADRTQSLLLEILIWTSAALTIVAIGLSRIYLGVHHPTDVLAGFLAATIWVSSIIALDHIRQMRRKHLSAKEISIF
ncbi:MAG TPA: phosphatase PAP2 family protein [Candidatus Angelobacter sp.]|jgi:undecaprenyl-diphosphatase|nr:phosphatase PAP2 family protein [Candidatus Angelobacter sp.]